MAEQLIESLSAEFEPEKFEDTYREPGARPHRAQGRGRDRDRRRAAAGRRADKVVDLMAALEASVKRPRRLANATRQPARRREAG